MLGKGNRLCACVFVATIMLLGVLVGPCLGAAPEKDTLWVSVPKGVMLDSRMTLIEDYGSFKLVEMPRLTFESLRSASPKVESLDYMKRVGFLQASFDPLNEHPSVPSGLAADAAYYASNSYQLVQLRGPVKPQWKADLSNSGKIERYIPYNTFIVKVEKQALSRLSALPFVRWVGPYEPFFKMEQILMQEKGEVRILIETFEKRDVVKVVETVLSHGGWIESVSIAVNPRVVAHVPDANIPSLAMMSEVFWVQGYRDATFLNGQAQWVIQSGQSNQRPIWDKGLKGEGQIVGYGDTGLDYDHSFFRDPSVPKPGPTHRKVIGYKHWAAQDGDGMGHGTHVAGSIAGNDKPTGGSSANIGEAPGAKLFVDDVSNTGGDWSTPSDLNLFFLESFNASANLHSNSWGWPQEHTYTAAAHDTDEFMWNHKNFLIVIAAGNERGSGQNSLRSPGLAKDVVTVGATDNGASANDMAGFSSVGPTNPDGRLKPTVCAPGADITSAQSDGDLGTNNSGETQMSGTSMATPTTSGGLALVRQYFTEGWYPSGTKTAGDELIPTAALMKAVLMAGAVEITGSGSDYNTENVYPNNSQGYGRVLLDNSLYFSGDASKLSIIEETSGLNTSETKTYSLDVLSDTQPLRIILVWTDYFGQVNANPTIVNNLDLEVADPSANVYKGNNYQGKNPGHSVTGGNADTINVEEGVLLPNAANGLKVGHYSITVKGTNVPQGPQPFAIAIIGDVTPAGQGPKLSKIDVTPQQANITADQTQQYTAVGYDINGNQTTIKPSWKATGGSISNAGLYTPGPVGTFRIYANQSGVSGMANITVTIGALASIDVTPKNPTITVDQTQQFAGMGKDSKGNNIPLAVNWTTNSGSITAGGLYTPPTKVGTYTVWANASGKSGNTNINVTPGVAAKLTVSPKTASITADQTQQFTGVVEDKYGNKLNSTPQWSASGGGITASGLYTPKPVGTFTITGSSGSISDTASVTVTPGAVDKITVDPPFKSITTDETLQFTATGTDAKGNAVSISPAWGKTGGQISPSGLYTPGPLGTFTVYANQSGKSGSAQVVVRPGALSIITIDPASVTVSIDAIQRFTAKGFDSKGNGIKISPKWSADDGMVNSTGYYTPSTIGQWKVTVSDGAITAIADVTVIPGELKRATITPPNATLRVGDSQTFSVKGFDSKGNELDSIEVSWSVTSDVGSVTQDGQFTASKAGKGKVMAQVKTLNKTVMVEAPVTVKEPSFTDAVIKFFGGETNLWIFLILISVLIVALIVAAAFYRRKKRWQEDYQRAMWEAPSQAGMGGQSQPLPVGYPPPPGQPPPEQPQQYYPQEPYPQPPPQYPPPPG